MSTQGPDESDLVFIHAGPMERFQDERRHRVDRGRPGHVIKDDYRFLLAPGQFFQRRAFHRVLEALLDLLR